MGDTVNLAARLESAGKQYGVSLLAGEATVAAAGEEILSRDADLIRVVGKARPVRIYELLGERATASAADLERRRLYHEALALFRERAWERALEAFVALGPDSLAQIYVERCREFLRSAPPGDWDGVFDLKSK
jgi:adenylate cyclase